MTEQNLDLIKIKRNSPDILFNEENKRIKCEIQETTSFNNILNGEEENELIKKYQNISSQELENICERLMYYDSTGIYIPPKDFSKKCACPKTKKSDNVLSKVNSEEPVDKQFGKGAVGVASNHFNSERACYCCLNSALDLKTNHKSISENDYQEAGFSGATMTAIPSTSTLHKNENLLLLSDTIDQFSDFLEHSSALDLSMNNINMPDPGSDSSNTIYYSDDSHTDLLHSDLPLNLSQVSVDIQNMRQISQNESVITIPDIPTPRNSHSNDIVDLTNVSNTMPLLISSDEIINLDDTFQTNLTPGIVETIDLVDSDSDDDIKITYNESDKLNNDSKTLECPICFEALRNQKIMTTICGHIFCSKCIRNAIKSKKCCPSCRKKLKTNDIHPIYLNL